MSSARRAILARSIAVLPFRHFGMSVSGLNCRLRALIREIQHTRNSAATSSMSTRFMAVTKSLRTRRKELGPYFLQTMLRGFQAPHIRVFGLAGNYTKDH